MQGITESGFQIKRPPFILKNKTSDPALCHSISTYCAVIHLQVKGGESEWVRLLLD